jgi:hypothetical protein
VPLLNDVEFDVLISRLSAPLAPDMQAAFRQAAEAVVASVSCPGEGSLYRAVAPLQGAYFVPPDDHRATWDISHELGRHSKLKQAPPIKENYDRRFHHLRLAR